MAVDYNGGHDDDVDDVKVVGIMIMAMIFTKSWLSAALAPAMTQSWAQTRAISMFIWITWNDHDHDDAEEENDHLEMVVILWLWA